MNESERLAEQMKRALDGDAWHGPSWREILAGVSRAQALGRPIPEAHTIAEIVLHATTWHDVVRRRLMGESPPVSAAEDWPAVSLPDEAAWTAAVQRLLETGHALLGVVREFPAGRLLETRAGTEDVWYELIMGEVQHDLYHAGQVALLRKASGA